MTVTTALLFVLLALTALLCLAFWSPGRPLNPPHPFDTDPFETEGEHPGRHRLPGEFAEQLAYPRIRAVPDLYGTGCRCSWLGEGTPEHAPSYLCISLRPDADRDS